MGTYRTAQICPNGHVITPDADVYPERTSKFCDKCGEATITECTVCGETIRGRFTEPTGYGGWEKYHFSFPAYCHNCGDPYPWTSKSLAAAKELADEAEELTEKERSMLAEDLVDLSNDTPRAPVAAKRFKGLLAKVSGPARDKIYQFAVDVTSSTVVRLFKEGGGIPPFP